ncbi:MAG: 5-amino-6-(D-ribitylamino)uracil--L-tyrosine 4-hydroxyphenyl transferase CofH, partial [Deltaproteobacteria bacterium]|nr:5-amino-6-(D-ribitylamino)uracil--L-tyrosine 4-hydroxyphenyl transferase CofH [Kofleriaceae bacterium]
ALAGRRPSWRELLPLTEATGADLHALCATADALRAQQAGELVTYVVNRNINFTNVCVKKCAFCAFSRNGRSEEGYFLDLAEIVRRVVEARAYGATEVCIQAGLAPGIDGMFYVDVVRAVKRAAPAIHVHAFSPEEVKYGAHRARLPVREYLQALREAGLGSLPGTSAEILDDDVRARLAPGRITSAEWLDVVRTAHEVGLRTTATMMYGHLESPADRLRHMETIRDLQRDTGGFTEFVPLSFVHEEAPLFAAQPGVRPGPGGLDVVRTHALARVLLGADVANLQVSWVKEGFRVAEHLLACGVNDLGGTLMNESISTSAGARHGQVATPAELQRLAHGVGRVAAERTTLYGLVAPGAGHRERDALERVGDAAATFGTYAALTRDPRFRFQRRLPPVSMLPVVPTLVGSTGQDLVEVGGRVEVEGEAVGAHHRHAQPGGGGADQVAGEAVAVAETRGHGRGQAQGEGVGAELISIRRKHQVRAV